MRVFGAWVAGIVFAVVAVGIGVAILATPPATRALAEQYSLGQSAGLSYEDSLDVAERVRAFVVRGSEEELPDLVAGRPGFDAAAIAHLRDVRTVLRGARLATLLLAVGLALWVASAIQAGDRSRVGLALYVAAGASAVFVVLAALAALADFSAFFSAFHGLFFADGTWTFPDDSLLILLFPEPFWMTAGAAWGALVLLIAAAYWIVGRSLVEDL